MMQVAAIVKWLNSFYFKYPLNFAYTSAVPIVILLISWWKSSRHLSYSAGMLQGAYFYAVGFIVFGFFFNFINNRESGYLRQLFFFTGSVKLIVRAWLASQTAVYIFNFTLYFLFVSLLLQKFSLVTYLKDGLCGWIYLILLGELMLWLGSLLKIRRQTAILIPSLLYLFFLSLPFVVGTDKTWTFVNPNEWLRTLHTHLGAWQTWVIVLAGFIVMAVLVQSIKAKRFMPVTRGGM